MKYIYFACALFVSCNLFACETKKFPQPSCVTVIAHAPISQRIMRFVEFNGKKGFYSSQEFSRARITLPLDSGVDTTLDALIKSLILEARKESSCKRQDPCSALLPTGKCAIHQTLSDKKSSIAFIDGSIDTYIMNPKTMTATTTIQECIQRGFDPSKAYLHVISTRKVE